MATANQAIIEFVKDVLHWIEDMGRMYGKKHGKIESAMWAELDTSWWVSVTVSNQMLIYSYLIATRQVAEKI